MTDGGSATGCVEQMASNRPELSETGRGLGPWLEFGDVESQLRFLRPAVLRKYVAASMLPIYALLAREHGYEMATTWKDHAVRLVLCRSQDGPPAAASLA